MKAGQVLALIRTLAEEPTLKPFCQRSFSLELLFILAEAERTRQELGVEECFEALVVARPTRGTFSRCYQSLVEEGCLEIGESSAKRSKRAVRLSPTTAAALRRTLAAARKAGA
jgi:hypothetical protein